MLQEDTFWSVKWIFFYLFRHCSFERKLFYKSNRKLFSCVCIAWYKHLRGWENSQQLCKPQTCGSSSWASGFCAGGQGSNPKGRTNTQGLNNNWGEGAAFVITSANGWTFKSSWIRTVNRRSHLIALVSNQIVWDVKEPTHLLKRVGDIVPSVVDWP